MKSYCEIVTQTVLPAMRGLIAKTLIEKHRMTQVQAAEKLGLSQAAVSQYLNSVRGANVKIFQKNKPIMSEVERIANELATKDSTPSLLMESTCKLCKEIRKSKLICEIHKENSKGLENCSFCC